jgi:hypothetical protein
MIGSDEGPPSSSLLITLVSKMIEGMGIQFNYMASADIVTVTIPGAGAHTGAAGPRGLKKLEFPQGRNCPARL